MSGLQIINSSGLVLIDTDQGLGIGCTYVVIPIAGATANTITDATFGLGTPWAIPLRVDEVFTTTGSVVDSITTTWSGTTMTTTYSGGSSSFNLGMLYGTK